MAVILAFVALAFSSPLAEAARPKPPCIQTPCPKTPKSIVTFDMLWGPNDDEIQVWDKLGSWQRTASFKVSDTYVSAYRAVALGDPDNDGRKEIVAWHRDSIHLGQNKYEHRWSFHVFEEGSTVANARSPYFVDPTGGNGWPADLRVIDVDGDRQNEVVVLSPVARRVAVYSYVPTSGYAMEYLDQVPESVRGGAIGDLDDDGLMEIVLPRDDVTAFFVWKQTPGGWVRTRVNTTSAPPPDCCKMGEARIGNVDGWGAPEVVVARNDWVGVFRYDGDRFVLVAGQNLRGQNPDSESRFDVKDLNWDGAEELVFGTTDYTWPEQASVWAFRNGTWVKVWSVSRPTVRVHMVMAVEADGRLDTVEIVLFGAYAKDDWGRYLKTYRYVEMFTWSGNSATSVFAVPDGAEGGNTIRGHVG